MWFGERDVENSFDSLFDLNRDGALDAAEQSLQYDFLDREAKRWNLFDDNEDEDDFDEDF